jgi:CheY-like chemotaxis protein
MNMQHGATALPARFGVLRVVIVDDVSHARILLRGVLLHLGLRNVTECASREEAFDAARFGHPDLVITDWDMPGGSGLELVRDIRTSPYSPDPSLPVILLTAHGGREQVALGRDAGTTDFLVKPFMPASLAARIRDVVARQRANIIAPGYVGPDRRRVSRAVPRERRAEEVPEGVTVIAPDGLLVAKISGNSVAIEEASQRRAATAARFHAAPRAGRATPPLKMAATEGAVELGCLIDAALADPTIWPQSLPLMVPSLSLLLRSAGARLPPPLQRVGGQFREFTADAGRIDADPQLASLLLLTLRAMLLIGSERGAERTAHELAGKVETLAAKRLAG